MDSIDILHEVNQLSSGICNLRFCNSDSLLDAQYSSCRNLLSGLLPYISPSLHDVLLTSLIQAYSNRKERNQ